jgi:hypothetical protein
MTKRRVYKSAWDAPRARGSIETDTAILPDVVAASVVAAAERLAEAAIPETAVTVLTERAAAVYAANLTFRRAIRRGGAGRDRLYVFMEHWLAAWCKKHAPKVALPMKS